MLLIIFIFSCLIQFISCLWNDGDVPFDISQDDFDPHSQNQMLEMLRAIGSEICVKFHHITLVSDAKTQILHIQNKDHVTDCTPQNFDFASMIVTMTVGYKCINSYDFAQIVVRMLRASITLSGAIARNPVEINPNDLRYTRDSLLSVNDRAYIDTFYATECSKSRSRVGRVQGYRSGFRDLNLDYYLNKIWPLGVVNYRFEYHNNELIPEWFKIEAAMSYIESNTCVKFHKIRDGEYLPDSVVFKEVGREIPPLGLWRDNQPLKIASMTNSSSGHNSIVYLNLLRILGLPLESNRADRDNYINIQWRNIKKGKEKFFQLESVRALLNFKYDFDSVLHPPVDWLCNERCGQTIHIIGDENGERAKTVGRRNLPSDNDLLKIDIIYEHECMKKKFDMSQNSTVLVERLVADEGEVEAPSPPTFFSGVPGIELPDIV